MIPRVVNAPGDRPGPSPRQGVRSARNRCSAWIGIGVRLAPESVFGMARCTQSRPQGLPERKNQIAERRFFPEQIRRREVLVADMIDDYLKRAKGALRSYREYERAGETRKKVLAGKTLRQVIPGDVGAVQGSPCCRGVPGNRQP